MMEEKDIQRASASRGGGSDGCAGGGGDVSPSELQTVSLL